MGRARDVGGIRGPGDCVLEPLGDVEVLGEVLGVVPGDVGEGQEVQQYQRLRGGTSSLIPGQT